MMKAILATFLITIFCGITCVNAQHPTITGTVRDSEGSLMTGTLVNLKGIPVNLTSSDKNGNFKLSLSGTSNDTLTFRHIGYEDQEIALNNQSAIDIKLVKANPDNRGIVWSGYRAAQPRNAYPVKIPNAHRIDNSIEIPNAYKGDQSIEIPNASTRPKILSAP